MISFETLIKVRGVTPKKIVSFFLTMNTEKYKKWHPGHIAWDVLERDEKGLPSRIHIEENFSTFHFSREFKLEKYIPDKLILLKVNRAKPIESYLSLSFKQEKGYTLVTHDLTFSVGRVIDWIIQKIGLFNKFEKVVHKHATEEFTMLEKML